VLSADQSGKRSIALSFVKRAVLAESTSQMSTLFWTDRSTAARVPSELSSTFIRPARSGSPMVPSAYGDRLACWRDGTAEITARLRDLDDDLAGVNVPEIVVRTDDQAVSLGCSTAAIAKANGGLGR
jgi:hypothetical protein